MTKYVMALVAEVFMTLFTIEIIGFTLGVFKISLDTGAMLDIAQFMAVYGALAIGCLISGIYSMTVIYSEDEG